MADLIGIAEYKLYKSGLLPQNITNPKICTKCNHNWFFLCEKTQYRKNGKLDLERIEEIYFRNNIVL